MIRGASIHIARRRLVTGKQFNMAVATSLNTTLRETYSLHCLLHRM